MNETRTQPNRLWSLAKALVRGEVRFFNYLIVGGLNTLFGYGVFTLMIYAGCHYSVAIAGSTILGTLFNFKSTGALVFKSHDNSKIVRFLLVYVVVYCVNVLGVGMLMRLGMNAYYSGMVMILPLALLAYRLNSQFVFKT
ncbi:putative O antigen biosynthesis protein [Paraburkholderia piptadeniae]|uniref:O antigen biosynthesis protein n=1 Tax=Paraburkholderia piptadeniae TaxID=1701573 RepID=A0A1N7SRZ9_9BURK|nr:GtrA family protein [Paraburkholderia piptadeniae]SIT50136.1 putative O antigen biosynthesis protein [Paraburkholderia piptadeniae]